jgi:hypothetical protein
MALESEFQKDLRDELEDLFPGCKVLKMDPLLHGQGIPDLLILYKKHWAALEVKRSEREPYRPNQEWYLDMMNEMSFAATIYPENRKEILRALQRSFRS